MSFHALDIGNPWEVLLCPKSTGHCSSFEKEIEMTRKASMTCSRPIRRRTRPVEPKVIR